MQRHIDRDTDDERNRLKPCRIRRTQFWTSVSYKEFAAVCRACIFASHPSVIIIVSYCILILDASISFHKPTTQVSAAIRWLKSGYGVRESLPGSYLSNSFRWTCQWQHNSRWSWFVLSQHSLLFIVVSFTLTCCHICDDCIVVSRESYCSEVVKFCIGPK